MKKSITRFSLFLILTCFVMLGLHTTSCLASDETPPVIHWDTLSVSPKKVQPGETVTLKVKITDDSDIVSVSMQTHQNRFLGESVELYPGVGDYYQASFSSVMLGTNQIFDLTARDVYGNETSVVNQCSDDAKAWFGSFDSIQTADMSQADFYVDPGSYKKETDAPIITDVSKITVSKAKPEYQDVVKISIPMKDASPILSCFMTFSNAIGSFPSWGEYNESTGMMVFDVDISAMGSTAISWMEVKDAWGNTQSYVNIASPYFDRDYPDGVSGSVMTGVDFSKADCWCGGVQKDFAGPEILLDTFRIDKIYLGLGENAKVQFKASDESPMNYYGMNIWFYGKKAGGFAGTPVYNEETGYFEIDVAGQYYGEYQIWGVEMTDVWGNRSFYQDFAYLAEKGETPQPNALNADLSMTKCYVGLFNDSVFASNSTMDETSGLDVDRNLEKAAEEALLEENYIKLDAMEIDVDGTLDMSEEKTIVALRVPKVYKDGERLRIRHLLASGQVQTQNATVDHGRVSILVDSFSPFLVEVAKDDYRISKITSSMVSLSYTSKTYTGSYLKPTVKVKGVASSYYKVSYSNNKYAGKATVTVTGINGMEGKVTKYFTIKKKTPSLSISTSSKSLRYSSVKSKTYYTSAISVKGVMEKASKTFTKVSGSSKLSIAKTSGKIVVKKGTKKGTYSIKVKLKTGSTKDYNSASVTKTIKVKVY